MKMKFLKKARKILARAIGWGKPQSEWSSRVIVRDGQVTNEYTSVRKASTIRSAARYNAARQNALSELESQLRAVMHAAGFTDDRLCSDGRCVWNLVNALRSQSRERFEMWLAYFEKKPYPYVI